MKISDAMRRGSARGPQLFGMYQNLSGGSCALGAMNFGSNGLLTQVTMAHSLLGKVTNCPSCGDCRGELSGVIIHLNDQHRWTREAIADWIEATFEATFETPVEQPVEKMIPAPEIMAYIGTPVKVEEPVCVIR